MKHIARLSWVFTAVALGIVLAGCASTSGASGDAPLDGREVLANEVGMVAGSSWGKAVQIARFNPGVVERGVESIEVEIPYGETAMLYYFHDLGPGAPVEFMMDAYIDTFMTNSFIEIGVIPGIVPMEKAVHPRLDLADHLAFKYIDSTGRFAGSGYPDATAGWERLRTSEFSADGNGDVTVMVILNHWTENPPVVYHYITNPVVRPVTE